MVVYLGNCEWDPPHFRGGGFFLFTSGLAKTMSDISNSLQISQTQRLQLNPQLLQSISVLCMNTAELTNYIDKLYQENPCIERTEPVISEEMLRVIKDYRGSDRMSTVLHGNSRMRSGGTVNTGSGARQNDDGETISREPSQRYVDDYIDSLSYGLKTQLETIKLPQDITAVCGYLIDLLEDNGWLSTESIQSVRDIGVPEELVTEAVRIIKSMEPAGVGAADTAEFVRLQLERYYPDEELAISLADNAYLEALSKHRYKVLADRLSVNEGEIRHAAELIAGLDADITVEHTQKSETVYVFPDVYIYIDDNGIAHADANEYDVPRVAVNDKYLELYKTTEDKELKNYLRDKISETYKLIGNIDRRKSTIHRCFELVAKEQQDYFAGRKDSLKPMTMSDAAESLELNVSTVSRCLMNKYVQCPQGLMPAKYFFSRHMQTAGGNEEQSQQGAMRLIAKLIESEDKHKPLSDSRLCDLAADRGFTLARRTIAKYRQTLGIPDYRIRKVRYMR